MSPSRFDKWIYVLKHMEALERMPFTAQKKIFKRLAELADSRCLSQEEQEKYDESLKAADDYYGVLMSYYMNGIDEGVAKGEAKGLAKGLANGRAKGRAEGRAEGLAEGENKANIATAQRLLAMGLSADQVSAATQLPLEHIEKLKSSLAPSKV